MIGTLHGGEILILIIAALVILGPRRLPEYAAKLAHGIRYLRDLAEGAKGQIQEELGPGFEDIDWRQLDPRQYDPRRIVREALSTPSQQQVAPASQRAAPVHQPEVAGDHGGDAGARRPAVGGRSQPFDPGLPTPFDVDAT